MGIGLAGVRRVALCHTRSPHASGARPMSAIPTPAELGSDAPIDVALLAARVHGVAGGLVGKSGKKVGLCICRWGTRRDRSNLKSEHPDTIRAKSRTCPTLR